MVDASSSSVAAQLREGVFRLVTAAQMQALDRQTIEAGAIPGELLMESAGRALVGPALALRAKSPRPDRPIRALCGLGNNGGDGFVVVRHLLAEGHPAEAILFGDPAQLPADAAANWRRLVERPDAACAWRVVAPEDASIAWPALFDETSVVVDALFGTGLRRAIGGGLARRIVELNAARGRGLRVLAVDLPSGIAADTGAILGEAVAADATVTISLPKPGLACEPGRSHAGSILIARVGIADPAPDARDRIELWSERAALARFPARPRAGHKGRFGHVLVAAGSPGKWGAASLASRAALRAGAGLVTLVLPDATSERASAPEDAKANVAGLAAEVMTERAAATARGGFSAAAARTIAELAEARSVLAIGPGLGQEAETRACVCALVEAVAAPLVVDADGLNALVGELPRLRARRGPTVLTPHPGEAGRLLGCDAAAVNADRITAARRLAEQAGAIVVLKGAGTVVASPVGRALVVPTGGPALGSGGTGDVLTGIVAALLASELAREPFEAAALAAWWHGATADQGSAGRIGFGLLASELADALPHWVDAARRREGQARVAGKPTGGSDEASADSAACLLLRFP